MTFQDLNIKKPLQNALDDLKYETPTTIQAKAHPVVMSGVDVIGIAQTGTGKTMAYLLPVLSQWQFSKERFPQILIVVPTRELVAQVVREIEKLTAYMTVATAGVYGGANINTQAQTVEKGLDVIVGTPGRLLDLALKGSLKLKNVKRLVIDEVDETLGLGFRPQLTRLFEYLPAKRQNLVFSATLSEEVEEFLQDFLLNPSKVEAAPAGTPLEKIRQSAYKLPNFYSKLNLLNQLLKEDKSMTRVLCFTGSRKLADVLYEEMEPSWKTEVGVIHSNKSQNLRFNTVGHFQSGAHRILIATDLISRGIDVSEVSHVINFDIPDVPENYLHRIGRTGRADKEGIAISFVSPKEEEQFRKIEQFMDRKVEISPLPDDIITSEIAAHEVEVKVIPGKELKVVKKEESGPAFHEKKAKNKKVNVRYDHKKAMMDKYGKRKTRGQKPKGKK